MIKWEMRKLLKNKSILISGIILILLCVMMSFFKPSLETENWYIDDKGNYITDTREGSIIANEKLKEKVSELKMVEPRNEKNDVLTKKIGHMAQEKLKSDSGNKYKNISFYKVFNYRIGNAFAGFIILGIIIYIFSNIYTDEKLSNVDSIVLSSKNKYKVLLSKLNLSIIIPVLIYFIYIVVIGIITIIQYGSPVNGGLQAYRIIDVVTILKSMNINLYIMINIFTMMTIFVSIGVFASFFSFITKNSVESIVGITVFLIIGKLISLIRFLPTEFVSVIKYSNYIDILMNPQMVIGNYLGNVNIFGQSIDIISLGYATLIAILIFGIVLNIYIFRRILSK